jgi:hypothetical protein
LCNPGKTATGKNKNKQDKPKIEVGRDTLL